MQRDYAYHTMPRTRPEGGTRVVLWAVVLVLVGAMLLAYLYLNGAFGAPLG